MKKQRTPQEKKQLSYERDRRNVYGEAPHAARKGIPLRKALRNRANRHNANQQLDEYTGVGFDEDLANAIESRLQHKPENDWKKHRDAPLGEVIAKKSRDRATMRKAGGRSALTYRFYVNRPTRSAPGSEVFADYILDALREAKILGVRSGTEHRYTGVWVVVVDKRVFVRSWNDKPTGWYRAFKKEPVGMIQVGELEDQQLFSKMAKQVAVRAKTVRSVRMRDAVTAAIAEKYPTKGSRKWVEGFAEPARVHTTLEFVPE